MKISDIFNRQSVYNSNRSADAGRAGSQEQDRASRSGDGDRISISPLARQFKQVSQILAEDESSRAKRVANLKEQVTNGSYEVSSGDVARSIVSFAKDVNP
jgi:flagellar biosynthesis anti-sigma factor FlgM